MDDVQNTIKVQKHYLIGFEERNYNMISGTFYVRAFINLYADAEGLIFEELLLTIKMKSFLLPVKKCDYLLRLHPLNVVL